MTGMLCSLYLHGEVKNNQILIHSTMSAYSLYLKTNKQKNKAPIVNTSRTVPNKQVLSGGKLLLIICN